jgi:hypothetical protein
MKPIEIRIRRDRTILGHSTLEALEKFASLEGRTPANALLWVLESDQAHARFVEFVVDLRKFPGLETI